MGEPVFVGPDNLDNVESINLDNLKNLITQKWSNAVITTVNINDITIRWNVLDKNWYLECNLISQQSLSIQSNDPMIKADVVLWFYDQNPNEEIYLYNADTAINPYRLTDNTSTQDVLNWIQSH